MNCHQREWLLTVVSTSETGVKNLSDFCGKLINRKRIRWRDAKATVMPAYGRLTTRSKYFTTELGSQSPTIETFYEPREVKRGSATMYEYPLYVDDLKIGKRRVFIMATPYVELNREIWRNTGLSTDETFFLAPSIKQLFQHISQHSPKNIDEALATDSVLTVLRGARINFADDPNLRGAVLVGENVMQSRLYKQLSPALAGGGAIWLAGAVAKIGFWGSLRRRIVIQMDRFGNFRVRPGPGGTRVPFFKEFLTHLSEIGGITWRTQLPSERMLSLAGETTS